MFHLTPWTYEFFRLFRRNPCLLAALQKKTVEWIFMKFSEKDIYDTRSSQEQFRDVTINLLNPGWIYLFP